MKDPLLLCSSLLGGLAVVVVFLVVIQHLMVDARQKLVDFHYGMNVKTAASRVDSYLQQRQQQLAALAGRESTVAIFSIADKEALDRGENIAKSIITDAEEIYYLDPAINRHMGKFGFAAKYMLRLSQQGKEVDPRAVKINNQWKILFSQPVFVDGTVAGTILAQMPTSGLRFALGSIDSSLGLLELRQVSSADRSIVFLAQGDSSEESPTSESFDTTNPLWNVTFTPSIAMLKSIDNSLPPYRLFFSAFVCAVLMALGLLIRSRLGQPSLVKAVELDNEERTSPQVVTPTPIAPVAAKELSDPIPERGPAKEGQPVTELEEVPSALEEQLMESLQSATAGAETTHAIPDVVFRDYDIRGIAGTELTVELANRLGRALGTLLRRNAEDRIYIGRDARLSSPELCNALQEGLISCGIHVVDLGEITTPALNFATHFGDHANNGIMVTASHNPAAYNGFKIIIQRQVISGQTLQMLKPMLQGDTFATGQGTAASEDIVSRYIAHIAEQSHIDRSFKLVIDGANCVPGPIALELFDQLGCMAYPLHCTVDGSFPNHEPNPAEEKNLADLRQRVLEEKADLGLAFDGDGDRVVVISAQGRTVWPDQLMMIFARDILARKPGSDIIFDVKSSKRLPELIRSCSGRPVMCKTGHAHVRKQVHDNNAPLGGEFSGHIFFNDRWKGFDDGLYAAVRLLEVLSDLRLGLDEVLDQLQSSVYTPEILIPIGESEKFELMKTLESGCQFAGAQVITIDGLRVEYSFGWGLIRASNTSANLTLRFEADDEQGVDRVKQEFRRELAPFINNIEDYI